MPTRTNKATVPDRYMTLIQRFRLRPICTADAYEAAMKVMDAIMKRDDLTDDCHWALQNQPLMGASKPATFLRGFGHDC